MGPGVSRKRRQEAPCAGAARRLGGRGRCCEEAGPCRPRARRVRDWRGRCRLSPSLNRRLKPLQGKGSEARSWHVCCINYQTWVRGQHLDSSSLLWREPTNRRHLQVGQGSNGCWEGPCKSSLLLSTCQTGKVGERKQVGAPPCLKNLSKIREQDRSFSSRETDWWRGFTGQPGKACNPSGH